MGGDTSLEKIVTGIKHNTLRSVVLRGVPLPSKQFQAMGEALKVNTTVLSIDLSGKNPMPLVLLLRLFEERKRNGRKEKTKRIII